MMKTNNPDNPVVAALLAAARSNAHLGHHAFDGISLADLIDLENRLCEWRHRVDGEIERRSEFAS